jgi:hypothetical protein
LKTARLKTVGYGSYAGYADAAFTERSSLRAAVPSK